MGMNVEDLCAMADPLSPDGRNEIREGEGGFVIPNAHVQGGLHADNPGFG
jgi:hypothetical protein